MAATLKTFVEVMNDLPDNSAQLISAEDLRAAILSTQVDRGQIYGDPAASPWTVPIPAVDTWVDIPTAIGGTVLGDALFWRQNGLGQLVYNYQADWGPTVVPPGYVREVQVLAVVEFDPGAETWEFAVTIGGVIQEPIFRIDSSIQTDSLSVPIVSGDPVDVSAAPPVSLSVRNVTSAADLPLSLFALRATGGIKAS